MIEISPELKRNVIWYFLIYRTKILRETSFQQVLLSSSGPKENIFISNFDITLGVSENVMPNNIINNNLPIL